jgi:hypothetical protein
MNEDDDILRPNKAQAMRMARRLGCDGAHEFEGSWMPCGSHDELTRILNQINSLEDKDTECLPCSQGKSAEVRKRKRRGARPSGWDLLKKPTGWENLEEAGVVGIDSLSDGSLISAPIAGKAANTCPKPTQDIALNLRNRKKAIDDASYGPLNPNEKNTAYWSKLAGEWDVDVATAKKQRCGNCALFIVTDKMKDCIEQGVTGGERKDEWDAIDAVGELGYCEAFDFKCAAKRTCRAWVTGGPITEEKSIEEKAERRIRRTDPDVFANPDSARVRSRQLGCIGIRRYRTDDEGEAWMPCTNESDYRLRMGSSPLARRRNAERDKNFVRRVALAASKLNRKKSASSDPRTPAPKKDRIFGSDKNRSGSASSVSDAGSIEMNDAIVRSLTDKVKMHNERMQKANKPSWSRANLRALKAVYRRGGGAFSRSHRPGMARNQWAMGRVNAFLRILSSGRPKNPSYVTDNDLLPEGHPWKKREKSLVQRVMLPEAIDNLKGEGKYWTDIADQFQQVSFEQKAAKRKAGAKLRTIGQEIAKRGGALVDEDGMLRCPPTTLNGGQFTNWKLEGCNDPTGTVRVIAQRVSQDAFDAIPETRRITNSQAAQIARQGVVTSRLTEGARSSIKYRQDIFRKINPKTRQADRLKALKDFDTASRRALSSRIGDRDLSEATTDELDQIIAMTNDKGKSIWSERQSKKLLELRQKIDDLETNVRSIQILGTDLENTYAVPRNVSVTFDADDIFDENNALSLDGEEGVFRWLSDNIDEITSTKKGSSGTVINAVYDDESGTITFDIADVYDKSETSSDTAAGLARAGGAGSFIDMDMLADRDMDGAFIDAGGAPSPSTYMPSQPTTDVRVRRPRLTDPTGQVSRLAGQDKVGGQNYTPAQKAAMVNAMIDGVPGLGHIKPVPTLRAGDADYTDAQLMQIDDAIAQINNYVKDNMMRLLAQYDSEEDREFRARAKHWYPVANEYIASIGAGTDIHPSLIAGAMAAMSPQLAWESNVALGEHMARMIADPNFEVDDDVAEIMAKNIIDYRGSQSGKAWASVIKASENSAARIKQTIDSLKGQRNRGSKLLQKRREGSIAALEYQLSSLERDMEFLRNAGDADVESMTAALKGKRIQDMSNLEVAFAHRAHASIKGMKYINGTEGPLMQVDLNPDPATGKANPRIMGQRITGAYLANDVKAAQMLRDGDRLAALAGDLDSPEYSAFLSSMISSLIGDESKVRSFYNNLNNPMDSYYRDITNDTWMAVAGFALPAMAATTLRNGKAFNETDVLFNSLESLGHGRGYGLVSAAIMNIAEEWKQLTGEDFTKHPRAMQSVLWELARREWLPGNKMEALAASRELADAISSGRSEFGLDDRHEMLGYLRTATYGKKAFPNSGGGIVEFLKSRGVDTDIDRLAKMSVQDRIWQILSVMKDSRGRPLFKGPIPIAQKSKGAPKKTNAPEVGES